MTISFSDTGLVTQSLEEIREEIKQSYINKFGNAFDISDTSLANKEISIYSERELSIHEAIQGVYSANYRKTAAQNNLDLNAEYTGHERNQGTYSSVDIYVKGSSSINLIAGDLRVSVDVTGNVFENDIDATLADFTEESIDSIARVGTTATATISGGHSYAEDDYVFIEGADDSGYNLLTQIRNVTSTTFDYTVDSGLSTPATGNIVSNYGNQVSMKAVEIGPIVALAGDLKNIVGTVSGVTRVENANDAVEGSNVETDAEFRQRMDETVSIAGGGFREAIISKIKDVTGVTSVTVYENNGFSYDGNRPPGSVEVFVFGGDDTEIATAIFNSVSSGIQAFGNTTIVVQDSEGQDVSIGFTRLSEISVYVDITITKNTDANQGPLYPDTGDDDIKTALALLSFSPGYDVWETSIRNTILGAASGISSLSFTFGTTANPTGNSNISISATEFASIDSTNITINGV